MAWNLNNKTNEYILHRNQSKELIDIYGVQLSYFKITNKGKNTVFQEYTYKESNPNNVFSIMMYPENVEAFDNAGDLFSKFGMQITDTINLIVSTETFKDIYDLTDFKNAFQSVGDIIKTPRGKLFEVTGVEDEVPGLSNIFTSNNGKNVLMLKCNIYNYKPSDKVPEIVDPSEYDFSNLDSVFNGQKEEQEVETTTYTAPRDSVFGDLG
jgi:hypothetical protein